MCKMARTSCDLNIAGALTGGTNGFMDLEFENTTRCQDFRQMYCLLRTSTCMSENHDHRCPP